MGFLCSPQAASFPLPSPNRGSGSGFVLTLPCLRLHGHLTGSVLEAAPSSAWKKPSVTQLCCLREPPQQPSLSQGSCFFCHRHKPCLGPD